MRSWRAVLVIGSSLLLCGALSTSAWATDRPPGHAGSAPAVSPPIVPHGFFGFPNFPPHAGGARPIPPRGFPPGQFPHHHHGIPVIGGPVGSAFIYTPAYVPSSGYVSSYDSGLGDYGNYGTGNYGTALSAPPALPPVAMAAPLMAAPPMTNVIQYPTGRYELRGDGLAVPYTWVWIPNPPPAPPTGPPAGMSAVPPPAATERFSERHDKLYRWTDRQGVLHITDRLESVPPEYRSRAQSPEPS